MESHFAVPQRVATPLVKCAVCGGSLAKTSDAPLEAKCYDMGGVYGIEHLVKDCNRRKCRLRHHYHYYILGHKKINTLCRSQLEYVFVSGRVAFTARFLKYHSNLQFRAAISARAVDWAYSELFPGTCSEHRFRRQLSAALLCYDLVVETEPFGGHKQIVVPDGDRVAGLPKSLLDRYDKYTHEEGFTMTKANSVREVVGDGHVKVFAIDNAGADDMAPKNGWFMLVHPAPLHILCATPMRSHENNELVTESLVRTLPKYPNCNGFMLDRQCKYAPRNASNP